MILAVGDVASYLMQLRRPFHKLRYIFIIKQPFFTIQLLQDMADRLFNAGGLVFIGVIAFRQSLSRCRANIVIINPPPTDPG